MTKERLRAYRHLKYEADNIRSQIVELETRMYSAKGQIITGMPHSGSGNHRTTEELVAVHAKLIGIYEDKLIKLEKEQIEVVSAIDSLPPAERQVLSARYISGLSWEKVCAVVHYEWAQTHRIHASGLRLLSKEDNTNE